MANQDFEERTDAGAYFVSSTGGAGSGSVESSTRVQKGATQQSMLRFLNSKVDNEEGPKVEEKMTPAVTKEQRNKVCLDIGRFFYENRIHFNVATSTSFASMLRSVGNYGRGLKPPTMYELRTWILQEEVNTTKALVAGIKDTWKSTGVSLLSDGCSDMRNRSLINFLVNNPHGTVFLKTVDASDCIKNADKLFELLDAVIEEIGEDNVVQVVTDNASAYKKAGELLMEKRKSLYWTPYAAHCIDLMLEKITELTQLKRALIKAKKLATSFITISGTITTNVFSREWNSCAWAKKADGIEALVEVLRIVDGERSPAMAFIYGAMDECKEKIASNFDNKESSYKEIWDIIDEKW
ncbi:uncharacterized protein LOC110869505 [Helianthus annuus]|uniref:uncharacterized protein LOC110869505 n=1 Tax=Helianthus annuus TaxID=4232 RepID=UPI000B8FB943|nr:uncharacterized protein LOC110869505 [Helianthus annuus]